MNDDKGKIWFLRGGLFAKYVFALVGLVVFVLAVVVREVVLAVVGVTVINEAATYVGRGALLVFGLDELVRGVNPFRRLLGVAVLGWQLAAIVQAGFV